MSANKINLMAIIITLFAIVFLTTNSADDAPSAIQCLKTMQTYCNETVPGALDCARAAVINWRAPLPIDYLQEYYELLFYHLDTSEVTTPTDFCRAMSHSLRNDCSASMVHYRMPTEDRIKKNDQRTYAVYIIFFSNVLNCQCEGSTTRITAFHERFYDHSYEQKYIISVHRSINVRAEIMYTPEEFCRTKYEPGFKIPALKECLITMETYCRERDPTTKNCVRAAFKYWRIVLPQSDIQEYYEALFTKLDIRLVQTPEEFCNKQKNFIEECRIELGNYFAEFKITNLEQQYYAVHYAFFYTALSTEDPENLTFEDKYIIRILQNVVIDEGDMDSPEVFCRTKHELDYRRPVQ